MTQAAITDDRNSCGTELSDTNRFPLLPWLSGFFITGLFWGDSISPLLPDAAWLFAVSAILFIGMLVIVRRFVRLTFLFLSSMIFGMALMAGTIDRLHGQINAVDPFIGSNTPITIRARIRGFPRFKEVHDNKIPFHYWRVRVSCTVENFLPPIPAYPNILLTMKITDKSMIPQIGDTIKCSVYLRYPSDYKLNRYLTYRDYLYNMETPFLGEVILSDPMHIVQRSVLWSCVSTLRRQCLAHLETGIEQTAEAELLKAMIIGHFPEIDRFTIDRFADLGIIHIIVISGLHVACLTFFLLTLIQLTGVPRRVAQLLIVPILLLYLLLVGFKVSIVRAVLMIIFYFTADIFNRERNALHACMVAGVLQLLFMPRLIFDHGFHYSFLALFGILGIYPSLKSAIAPKTNSRIIIYALVTLSVWIAIGPLVAYRQGVFIPLGFVLGGLAVLLVQLVVEVGIIAVIAGFISRYPAEILNHWNYVLAKCLFVAVQFVYELYSLHFYIHAQRYSWLVVYYISVILMMIFIRQTTVRFIALGALCAAIMITGIAGI